MNQTNFLDILKPVITYLSNKYRRNNSGSTEEDMYQELCLHLIEKQIEGEESRFVLGGKILQDGKKILNMYANKISMREYRKWPRQGKSIL